MQSVLTFAHTLLKGHLKAGDKALDGTAGNGHDTLWLAQCVGEAGEVWAFDVQQTALENTAARLRDYRVATRVHLVHDSHAHLAQYIQQPLAAAVFNFGWLPSGNKNITTHAVSSVAALRAVLSLLRSDGLLVAVLYPGHKAGREEAAAIEAWASDLPQKQFSVLKYGFINQQNSPPYLLAIEKNGKR